MPDDRNATDKNVLEAVGILRRALVSGSIGDTSRVEDNQVRIRADLDAPFVSHRR